MAANAGVTVDPVFVAVTRPPLKGGVTYSAFLFNVLLTVELFLVTHNLLWLLAFVPLHGICWLLCLQEPRYFDLLILWGRTRGPGLLGNARRWGANSYSPLRLETAGARRASGTCGMSVVGGPRRSVA